MSILSKYFELDFDFKKRSWAPMLYEQTLFCEPGSDPRF